MLKKCLKHEWKACWKNLTLLNGAAIFMGALGGFGFLFSQISELPDLLIVLYLFAYVLIVIAASVMTQVLMIQRYYCFNPVQTVFCKHNIHKYSVEKTGAESL